MTSLRLSDFARDSKIQYPVVKGLFFFDTETYKITQQAPVGKFVCMQSAFGYDQAPIIQGGDDRSKIAAKAAFFDALNNPDITMVAHNGFYDYSVMLGLHKYFQPGVPAPDEAILMVLDACLSGRIRDTLPMAKLNAIEYDWLSWDRKMLAKPKFNLAYLAKRFANYAMSGKSKDDEERVQVTYHKVDGLPVSEWPEEYRAYAIDDIVALRLVFKTLCNNEYADEKFQTAVCWVFRLMEIWGIRTSRHYVNELKGKIKPRIDAAVKRLLELGYMRQGEWKTDTERLEAFIRKLAEAKGIPVEMTPGGKVSTKASFLKKLDCPALFDKNQWKYQEKPVRNMELIRSKVEEWYSSRGLEVPRVERKANPHLEDDDDFYGGEEEDTIEEPNVSTSRDALAATDDEGLLALADIGKLNTLDNTFIPVMETGYDYPIHPYWNPLVNTGRPSCVNPNLLNQPREIGRGEHGVREAYKARHGYVFLDPDYTQAELCSLAQICKDKFGYSKMGEIIRSGKDLHAWFASMICNEPYDAVMAGVAAKIKKYVDLRQLAKAANFGFPGGLGIKKFIKWARKTYEVVISEAQAKQLKATWLAAFPEIRDYFDWVNDQIKRSKNRKTFTYVQHRSLRKRGGVGFCNGCNTGFQGLTADGAKNALISIMRACHTKGSALYGSRIVAFIYDEILVETPEANCHEAANLLQKLMVDCMNEYTPDVGASVTCEAMYNWSKKAKVTHDENGRLVPFDPHNKGID